MKTHLSIIFLLLLTCALNLSAVKPQQYYFVLLEENIERYDISKKEALMLQVGHVENTDRLYKSGFLKAAGDFKDGGGIFIMRAENRQEAIDSCKTDPSVRALYLTICYPLILLNGGFCDYPESTEKVQYYLVQFKFPTDTDSSNATKEEYSISYTELSDSIKNNYTILLDGLFTNGQGAVCIINTKDDDFKDIIEESALINKPGVTFTIRKIWVSKGIFCER